MYRIRTAITGGPGGSELNTMYFNSALTFTAQDAANAVHAFWTAVRVLIKSTYTLQIETAVTEVADFTGHPIGIHSVTAAAVTGDNSGDALPGASQGLLRFHTGVYYNGRELQGRVFIPGPTENDNTGGVVAGSYQGVLNTAGAALIADANSELMLFSRKNLNANGVTSAAAWNQWAVLRSRRS